MGDNVVIVLAKMVPSPTRCACILNRKAEVAKVRFFYSLGCVAGVRRERERGFCSAPKNVPRTRTSESARRLDFQRTCTELRGKASSTVLDGRESLFWRADIRALWLKKTVARIESYQNYRQ